MLSRAAILIGIVLALTLYAALAAAEQPKIAVPKIEAPKIEERTVRLRDISTVEGVRDNLIVGYGLVVGLKRTGDSQQTLFSTQTLANVLQRMGLQVGPQIPTPTVQVRNIAGVFVTATVPPFARPGMRIDVTVSSIGDARSIEGGLLLLTPLHASNGDVYAEAQGPLTIAGYTAGAHGNTTTVNQPTVGMISNGAIVERDIAVDISHLTRISLLLRDANFNVAEDAAQAIDKELGLGVAHAIDGTLVEVNTTGIAKDGMPALIARIGALAVAIPPVAKVVVNERTGTVVLGSDVSLGACSILQGSLTVNITTTLEVSQPNPLSKTGTTQVVPQTNVQAQENAAQAVRLKEGATVEDLMRGLQAIGATARDIVAILQAIKAAGALQAELEVI